MSRSSLLSRFSSVALLAGAALALPALSARGDQTAPGVTMPASLSPMARLGQMSYTRNCAACHGPQGGGTRQGPPLIHRIYEPSHHADIAFVMAIQRGTRQHHWPFGDMPPQPQVSQDEIDAIIRFVREVQRANGIE